MSGSPSINKLESTVSTDVNVSPASFSSKLRPETMDYPCGWYLFSSEHELLRGPVAKKLLNKDLVGFLSEHGTPGVIAARCVHMGADLGGGRVVEGAVECPLHNWRFGTDGKCNHIPASAEVPKFARQMSYPTTLRHGNLYFFNGPRALYPLPFFKDILPEELTISPSFEEVVECPWYMVGANAVDVQHFAIAHDRRMLVPPEVTHPSPNVHKTVCRFQIEGDSFADRITRLFGGPEARLEVTDWSSTMIFAHSKLKKAETFGMLSMTPLSKERTKVHVTVMARRGSSALKRLADPVRARVRRHLIRRFLRSDIGRLAQTNYSPNTLIEIDRQFAKYFDWLATVPR